MSIQSPKILFRGRDRVVDKLAPTELSELPDLNRDCMSVAISSSGVPEWMFTDDGRFVSLFLSIEEASV